MDRHVYFVADLDPREIHQRSIKDDARELPTFVMVLVIGVILCFTNGARQPGNDDYGVRVVSACVPASGPNFLQDRREAVARASNLGSDLGGSPLVVGGKITGLRAPAVGIDLKGEFVVRLGGDGQDFIGPFDGPAADVKELVSQPGGGFLIIVRANAPGVCTWAAAMAFCTAGVSQYVCSFVAWNVMTFPPTSACAPVVVFGFTNCAFGPKYAAPTCNGW